MKLGSLVPRKCTSRIFEGIVSGLIAKDLPSGSHHMASVASSSLSSFISCRAKVAKGNCASPELPRDLSDAAFAERGG
jgi:hypothetical protein